MTARRRVVFMLEYRPIRGTLGPEVDMELRVLGTHNFESRNTRMVG